MVQRAALSAGRDPEQSGEAHRYYGGTVIHVEEKSHQMPLLIDIV